MTARFTALLLCLVTALFACSDKDPSLSKVPVPGKEDAMKSTSLARAARRAFDGAPPVIPHAEVGNACTTCHNKTGIYIPDLGFAPPMPHTKTAGISVTSNCRQCHLMQKSKTIFKVNLFEGLAQDLRRGSRMYDHAPPNIPHGIFMREDCLACHFGPAAREEVRCTHPERQVCRQCHLQLESSGLFRRTVTGQ